MVFAPKHKNFFQGVFFGVTIAFSFLYVSASQTLSISPLRQTVVVDPGKKALIRVSVRNEEEKPITVISEIDAFHIDAQTGRAVFEGDDVAEHWIIAPNPVVLEPEKSAELFFTVNVPAAETAGGHYIGLFVRAQSGEAGTVALRERVGTLLFLYVGGEIEESLTKIQFSSEKRWYTGGPVMLKTEFKNTGSIHVMPEGGIVLTDMRGHQIDTRPLNLEGRKVLPGDRWEADFYFDDLHWRHMGRVTAALYVQYGTTARQMSDAITFWFLPLPAVFFASTAFFLVVGWLVYFSKKKRSRIDV